MIQYQFFHNGKEYVSKLSIPQTHDDYNDLQKLFSVVREKTEGNTFTYAPVDQNHFIIMQSAKSELGYSAKGIFGNLSDFCDKAPASYIDGITATPINKEDRPLTSYNLPRIDPDSFSSKARNLHHIFGKLFDAIVFTNKPIIILADNRTSVINYIKTLNLILPAALMRNVGFSIGMNSVLDESIGIIKNNGEKYSLSIRVLISEADNIAFESYSSSYLIFDTKNNRDNYTDNLSSTGRVLGDIDLLLPQGTNYIEQLHHAFNSNGTVNQEYLDQIAVIQLFELNPCIDHAKQVLAAASYKNNFISDAYIINAIQSVLRENSGIEPELEELIYDKFLIIDDLFNALSDHLYSFFKSLFPNLNSKQLECFYRVIAKDESGGKLSDILALSCVGNFRNMEPAFRLASNILDLQMRNTGINIEENIATIKILVEKFAIDSCYRIIPEQQIRQGEDFFKVIANFANEDFSGILISTLLASAYKRNTAAHICDMRLRGLKLYISIKQMSNLDAIKLLLSIRMNISEIASEITDLGIDTSADFIFNTANGRLWITRVVDSLSVTDLLDADALVLQKMSAEGIFDSLASVIRTKLLDIDFIKNNLNGDESLFDGYSAFFNLIEENRQPRDIRTYLNQLNSERKVSEEFAKFRFDFGASCIKTLAPSGKKELKVNEKIPAYEDLDESKRIELIEKTIKVFGTILTDSIGGGKRNFKGLVIWACLFSCLSMLILSLPSLIIPGAIGLFDVANICKKFLYYFLPEFFAIPLIIFGLNILLSIVIKKGNQVKRANIITLLCGILPVICLVVSYIVFYFIDINVIASLNIGG